MYKESIDILGKKYNYYPLRNICTASGIDIDTLPVSIKILLENLLRKNINDDSIINAILDYKNNISYPIEFYPSRITEWKRVFVMVRGHPWVKTWIDVVFNLTALRKATYLPSDIKFRFLSSFSYWIDIWELFSLIFLTVLPPQLP